MNPRDYTRIGRRLALALLSAAPIFAQCPTGTLYPGALDTNASLTVAKNNLTTTLTVNQQVTDTVAIVASTTGFVANMMIAVDSGASTEYEFVGSVSGANTLNVTRACDNSTAVVHLSGVSVVNIISAYSGHTSVTSPITAIETLIKANPPAHNVPVAEGTSPFTYLPPGASGQVLTSNGASADPSFTPLSGVLPAGTQTQFLRLQPNTGNNTTLQFASFPEFFARDYNFPAQSPGGSLIIGANTVTLTPCPQGVNGTDTGHSLYIQGGVGTAEAVLISGGSCTAGLASGNVIFTAANTHSGAWTIGSATGGIQEALIQGGPRSVTLVSPGTTATFAQITMPISATLACALRSETFASVSNNPGPCFLQFNQTSGDVIKGASGDTIIGLSMGVPLAYNGTPANVTAIDFTGGVGVKVISTEIYGAFIGVNFTQVNVATARDVYIANAFTNGIGFNCVTFDDIVIDGSQANGAPVSGAMKYSVFISDSGVAGFGGGIQLTNNDFFQSQFGLFIQSTTANGISQVLSNNEFYNHCTNTCIVATATTPGFARSIQINNVNIEVSQGDGVQIGGSTGNVDSVTISGGSINNNLKNGIHLETGALHTAITGVKVAQNSTSSPTAFSGLTVDAGVSFWNVSGGWFGPAEGSPSEPAVQAYAVNVASGASDNYSINGVYVGGNATGTINDLGTGSHKVIAHNLGSFSVTQSASSATGQTAAIGATNLLCNGGTCAAGQYQICYYLGITVTGTGSAAINVQWNDGAATQTFTSASVSAAALNFGQSCLSIRSSGSSNLLYSTNYAATGTYQIYVSVLRQQ